MGGGRSCYLHHCDALRSKIDMRLNPDPFKPNVTFLYSLKMSENLGGFLCFQGRVFL